MHVRQLFASPAVTISDVWCDPGHLPVSDLETEEAFGVSYPRTGVYVHRTSGGDVVVDPTVAVFRSRGDEHRTTHPTVAGDRNTDLQFPAEVVAPILDSRDRFRVGAIPISEGIAARHRRLLGIIRRGPASTLEIGEEALALVASTHQLPPFPEVARQHRPIVDEARQYLAWRFRDDLDLVEIARAVGVSPFHLSRMFKRATGRSLTGYRTALRIRFVIDQLTDGADDLGRVAVEAGFYDHAHMTNTVRRHLGDAPSKIRIWLAG
ncbi:MAG TPA: AraC family transcriptional regulator [Acidimicrobiia bacterium]|nr:AraC family transcriptional regulator [Acidimicrobiia bacterium]